jgi:Rha family phage regulatory protein
MLADLARRSKGEKMKLNQLSTVSSATHNLTKPLMADALCRVSDGGEVVTDSLIIAGEFERRHDNVLASLDSLIESGAISHLDFKAAEYRDGQGKPRKMYELTERGALIAMPFIGGRKSKHGQARLVNAFLSMRDRVRVLEAEKVAAAPAKLPTPKELAQLVLIESDRADAAEQRANDEERRAIRAESRVELLSGKVDELLPAAHALDDLVATPGSECITDASKTLGVGVKWLFLYLQAIEWTYKRGVRCGRETTSIPWTMHDEAWKQGYVERNVGHREERKPNGSVVFLPTNSVYITREGLKELAKRIAVLRADGKELPTTFELIKMHLARVDALKKAKKASNAA